MVFPAITVSTVNTESRCAGIKNNTVLSLDQYNIWKKMEVCFCGT